MRHPRHFTYELTYSLQPGVQAPTNTPQDRQNREMYLIEPNVRLIWPQSQLHYTHATLLQLLRKDFSNHPLVAHLHPLAFRKPCRVYQESQARQFQDFLVQKKKWEMQENHKWLAEVSKELSPDEEMLKTLKFKLNQISEGNFKLISGQILEMVQNNSQDNMKAIVCQIIDKAANQTKYRELYGKLCDLLTDKSQSFFECLREEMVCLIEAKADYQKLQEHIRELDKNDQLVYLNKRKTQYNGTIKFCAQLYKDYVFNKEFIMDVFITQVNKFRSNIQDSTIQKQFQDEPYEALLEFISTLKQNLFHKQYKEDIAQEKKFIDFLKQQKNVIWKSRTNHNFVLSKQGIVSMYFLNLMDSLGELSKHTSERLQLMTQTLVEKINANWQSKKQGRSKNEFATDSSDSDIQEAIQPVQDNKPQFPKLYVHNLDQIKEEDIEFSVSKQPTSLQILQQLDKIFHLKGEEFMTEIKKLASLIKLPDLVMTFWTAFLQRLMRLTKENCQRATVLYEIYHAQSDTFYLQEQIQQLILLKIKDVLLDALDSPFGPEFAKKCLHPFLQNDIALLQKLQADFECEEVQSFLLENLPRIVDLGIAENREALKTYFINQLGCKEDQIQF